MKLMPLGSLLCLAQVTRISEYPAQSARKFVELKPFKTTIVYELQPMIPVTVIFCIWTLESIHDGEMTLTSSNDSFPWGCKFTEKQILKLTQSSNTYSFSI
jgi:hypothetical protein